MPKRLVSQEVVIKIAEELLLDNRIPTVAAIRERLKVGSATTICKYLRQAKQQWFMRAFDDKNNSNNINVVKKNELEEERILKLELQKQLCHNETYAKELMSAETAIIKLTETNQQLQTTVQKLQNDLDSATKEKEILKDCYQKLTEAVTSNHDDTILQQEQTIESLRQEIQTINQASFNAVQQVSFTGHDALLQEKVKTLNLEEKVKELQQLVVQQQNKLAILSKALQQQQPLEFANYERIGHG
jgi:chromosome segregation ATPase